MRIWLRPDRMNALNITTMLPGAARAERAGRGGAGGHPAGI
jgi:hypothetical protein